MARLSAGVESAGPEFRFFRYDLFQNAVVPQDPEVRESLAP